MDISFSSNVFVRNIVPKYTIEAIKINKNRFRLYRYRMKIAIINPEKIIFGRSFINGFKVVYPFCHIKYIKKGINTNSVITVAKLAPM